MCRQRTHIDQVELTFRENGPYDEIEIHRNCELVARIDGATTTFLDDEVTPGLHEYAVRGIAGGISSDFARCSVRVGVGAILERALTKPLSNPGQITRNPLDGRTF